MGAENLAPTRIRSPYRPARSKSLYRLSYRGSQFSYTTRPTASKQLMSLVVKYASEIQHRQWTASHFGSNISLPSYISSMDSFEG
jgi:hypothetical protein